MLTSITPSHSTKDSYEYLLSEQDLIIQKTDNYIEIGKFEESNVWIYFIPVMIKDFPLLLKSLIPYLKKLDLAFKIPLNKRVHNDLFGDNCIFNDIGKIICIYSNADVNQKEIAKNLISICQGYKGGFVNTALRLDSLIFIQYQNFKADLSEQTTSDSQIAKQKQLAELSFGDLTIIENSTYSIGSKIRNKYEVTEVLRQAWRGTVLQAKYNKGLFNLKSAQCIIKLGKKGMSVDHIGRDIEEKLLWQKKLLEDLQSTIPLPKFIDYYKSGYDVALIMEFIDGENLLDFHNKFLGMNSWLDLPVERKLFVINQLLFIVESIEKLHKVGIIHRDITLVNFMLTKHNRIYFIDLELAYSTIDKYPTPPFPLGSPSYMSPEQERLEEPTFNQDIYYLGTLLLHTISRLNPIKFKVDDPQVLFQSLMYFIDNTSIAKIITTCLNVNPTERPSISEIKSVLNSYSLAITSNPSFPIQKQISIEELSTSVQYAIDNINFENFIKDSSKIDTANLKSYLSLQNGIPGLIYLIAYAQNANFNITNCYDGVNKLYQSLKEVTTNNSYHDTPGLYNGDYGIAISLALALESSLITDDEEVRSIIKKALTSTSKTLEMINGVAGYGIALINCSKYLPTDFYNERITYCVELLLNNQNSDGGWKFQNEESNQIEEITGFEHGVAGITYFLLRYYEISQNRSIEEKVLTSLKWLLNKQIQAGNFNYWPISNSNSMRRIFIDGDIGICKTLIKAYEITKDNNFKKAVESICHQIPERIVLINDTFTEGLPGLGEVYLEACRVFKQNNWYKRAEWIAGLYLNSAFRKDSNILFKSIEEQENFNLLGFSSATHFLISYLNIKHMRGLIFG